MATQTITQQPEVTITHTHPLLYRALMTNVAVSAIAGIGIMLASVPLADFMGIDDAVTLIALGIGMLIFAADVYYVATQQPISRRMGWLIFELDVLWVVGSILLAVINPFDFTSGGQWAMLIQADLTAMIAVAEFLGLRRSR